MPSEILLQKLLSNPARQPLPDKEKTQGFIENLFTFLFNSNELNKEQLENKLNELHVQLSSLISNCSEDQSRVDNFFEQLPAIYDLLIEDARAILNSDPAAKTIEEMSFECKFAKAIITAHWKNKRAKFQW